MVVEEAWPPHTIGVWPSTRPPTAPLTYSGYWVKFWQVLALELRSMTSTGAVDEKPFMKSNL